MTELSEEATSSPNCWNILMHLGMILVFDCTENVVLPKRLERCFFCCCKNYESPSNQQAVRSSYCGLSLFDLSPISLVEESYMILKGWDIYLVIFFDS